MQNNDSKILLEVKGLKKYFPIQKNLFGKPLVHLRAVDNVSFKLEAGKTIGVVGESGCGKTTLGRTILQLYDTTGGKTLYYGHTLDDFKPQYYLTGINKLPSYSAKLKSLKEALCEDLVKFDENLTIADYENKLEDLKSQLEAVNSITEKAEEDKLQAKKLNSNIKALEKIVNILNESSIVTGGFVLADGNLSKPLLLEKINKEKSVDKLETLLSKEEAKLAKLKSKVEDNNYEESLANAKSKLEELNSKDLKTEDDKKEISALVKKANKLQQIIDTNININNLNDAIKAAAIELDDSNTAIEELKNQIPSTALYNDLEEKREMGLDLAKLNVKEMRKLRTEIQLIFQDPYSSLPPRMTVGAILTEAVKVHKIVPKENIKEHIRNIMKRCGLQPQYYDRYPHEFSGGQRQRICIARALAVNPKLVICDEPVSALDVSIQAQIINLLKELQNDLGLTYLFISHDLSVVKYITDQIIVMYLGNMMEIGDTDDIFKNPLHPYTQALFSAVPVPDPDAKMQRIILKGDIPSPANPPKGCKFHTRCIKCMSACHFVQPDFVEFENGHKVACHLYNEEIMSNMEKYDQMLAEQEKKEQEVSLAEENKDE